MTDDATNTTRALSLAKLGWPVFPIKADSKRPLIQWAEGATTDAEAIVTMWEFDHPGALVGLHAGRAGLVIVDVDEKGCDNERHPEDCTGSGAKELERAGITLPKTFAYQTKSGGSHHVYAAPEGIDLTIAQDFPARHVDIRSGTGYVVYHGPALAKAPKIVAAPESVLKRAGERGSLANGSATLDAWLDRARPGKPTKKVRKALEAVHEDGMDRTAMLAAVTGLVKLGAERGVATAFAEARETYTRNYPDYAREWDNAAEGSVKKFGLPPVTFEVTKAERQAIARRSERDSEATSTAKPERKTIELTDEEAESSVGGNARYLEDSPIAEEVSTRLRGRWAYTSGTGILRYDGKVWSPAEESALVEATRHELKAIVAEEVRRAVLDDEKKRIPAATAYLNRGKIVAVARLAIGILAERGDVTDAHPHLLNVQNGVVDLRTGELTEHDPDLLFTRIAGTTYDPDATSELWDKALGAFASPKVARWMQVRMGQAITGFVADDDVMPILRGGGQNGKSTVFDGIRSAAGTGERGYAITVPKKLLLSNPGDHSTELTTLRGARLAVLEELPEGRNLDVTRLKDTVGTAYITARRMRQDDETWKATHSLFISTNYTPLVAETDHGTWRRLALVDFPWTFRKPGDKLVASTDREADPRLKAAFDDPNPAVLAWLVKGAVEWFAAGRVMPAPPKRVVRDTLDWRTEADPILGYVRDSLTLDARYAVPVRQLCDDFNHYLEQRNQKRWSDSTITSRFAGHVSLPGIVKRNTRFAAAGVVESKSPIMSVPQFSVAKRVQVGMALVGVRFRSDPDAVPPSREQDEFASIVRGLEGGETD